MIDNSIKQFRFMRQQDKDRLGTRDKTKERLGLAERSIAQSSYEMGRTRAKVKQDLEKIYNPAEKVNSWADEMDALRRDRMASLAPSEDNMRPTARYEQEFEGEVTVPSDLMADTEFTAAVSELASKHGIQENEVFAVIKGESAFDPQARNASGATGLFQFMPNTADELGVDVDSIASMSPAQQVKLYDRYLDRWNYSNENRLGIMQAAPAYADKSPEEVIYTVDSAAWRQNPGWRELNNGPITVRSINNYYAKKEV